MTQALPHTAQTTWWHLAAPRRSLTLLLALVAATLGVSLARAGAALADCSTATNPIACENALPGDPESDWQPGTPDDPAIEGFATQMSVNAGQTEQFKIKTSSTSYHIDILRIGYYGGNGARLITTIRPSVTLPQSQPSCITQSSTGLIDCGNWAVSASWAVPSTAVSGVYVAHLVRDDARPISGESSHIVFVVRNDSGTAPVILQTSDATWEAYNDYGGNSLYVCNAVCPPGNPGGYKGAFAVSYNRPFSIPDTISFGQNEKQLFWAEYPMIRFLERNGYNIDYTSENSIAQSPGQLLNHKIFMSSGHDEYWSAEQRNAVQAAVNAGVNLAFFSGNLMFWKTRWGNSIDGSNTAFRTLTSYKETHFNAPTDPNDPPTWTGTWRDPRFSPPADGGQPENALTGQLSMVDSGSGDMTVPAQYAHLRMWRNTQVSRLTSGQSLTLDAGGNTLGFEWDMDVDDGFRPPGEFDLSSTTLTGINAFYGDYGTNETVNTSGTHHLTEYRAASGALVFDTGTVNWAWGLDTDNPGPGTAVDPNMQQATINVLGDMGAQPSTLMSGMAAPTASSDTSPPTSSITSPNAGASVSDGNVVTISGTAADAGSGVVAGVEVSTDGGGTWHPATISGQDNTTVSWTYAWNAHGYPSVTVESRAVDDSGNLESPSDARTVNVNCPCSIWGTSATPFNIDTGDANAITVGVQFTTSQAMSVTGLRFYKASTNTGTHIGSLWTSSGQLLTQATFSGESASGWQTVSFPSAVAISPGTTYVATYFAPNGHYSSTPGYFYPPPSPPGLGGSTVNSGPVSALRVTGTNVNGLYNYGTTNTFPTSTSSATNYWVDPVFAPLAAPGQVTGVTASPSFKGATVSWSTPSGGPAASYTITPYVNGVAQGTVSVNAPANAATITGLTTGTTYTFTVQAKNGSGTGAASTQSNAITIANQSSLLDFGTPQNIDAGDSNSAELGVKFTSSTDGQIVGMRFYKASANTGTHIGSLWSSTGTLLAQATFTNETGSGWQQVTFSNPVNVTAGTTYVAGYLAPNGHYSSTQQQFASGYSNPPLSAIANSTSGNGVFAYSATSTFPTSSFAATNYWVDVIYAGPTAPGQVTGVTATAQPVGATVSWTAPSSGGGPTSYIVTPYIGSTAQTPITVPGTSTSTLVSPLTTGTAYTFTVQATNSAGSGPVSAASASVTPLPPSTPTAPQNVLASPATSQALVSWTAPASNGGATITGYTITPYIGTTAQTPTTVGASATSATITGLTNGTAYTFQVAASNSSGTGTASSASAAVTPEDTLFDFTGTPVNIDTGDTSAVTLGVKFTADTPGTITGLRFYKAATNTGTHIGSLWSASGTLLTSATFANESASGWQTVTFASPVSITAGTTYVAGYFAPAGHYSSTMNAFGTGFDNPPLHVVPNSTSGNGVYAYGGSSTFPTNSYQATNYWIDVLYAPPPKPGQVTGVTATAQPGAAGVSWTAPSTGGAPASYVITPYVAGTAQTPTTVNAPATSGTVTGLSQGTAYTFTVTATNSSGSGPASTASNAITPLPPGTPLAPTGVSALPASSQAQVSWTAPANDGGAAVTGYTITPYIGSTAQTSTTVTGSPVPTTANITGLTNSTAYTFKVAAINSAGTGTASAASSAVTPDDTLFDFGSSPVNIDTGDASAAELGVKFTSSTDGTITGLRFFKAAANLGTHVGTLWTLSGTQLAQATFTGESASGWQYVQFSSPVAVSAGTTYVAGYYAPSGHYSSTMNAFTNAFLNAPLQAVSNATSGNGVFAYSGSTVFPTNSYAATNYWVDPIFAPATVPGTPGTPTATAGAGSASVSWTAPSGGPVTSYTVTPYVGSAAQSSTTVNGTPAPTNATVTGLTPGTSYTFKVTASDSAGSGPASAASNAVTPTGALTPSAPQNVGASPATNQALVSWTAPASNGGGSLTGYTITPYIGTTAQLPVQVNNGSATSATVSNLTNGTAYTFTVTAANASGAGPASSASAAVTPQDTLLDFSGSPINVDSGDGGAITVGFKFTASANGSITGVRFYKASTNTGTHVATLWSATGAALATATFSGESASGWQQVYFSSPVSVTADTTYVASVYDPVGHYSSSPGAFSAAVINGPLSSVANSTSGNGVYTYGAGNIFPTSSYNATNYWIDVFYTSP
jgi:predicted RNA-binding protein with TRAM domain